MEITLKNISKKFGEKVIFNDFNLSVDKGEMVAVTGPSGKGKSTLLNIIGLIEKPDSGEIIIKDVKNPQRSRKQSTLLLRNTIGFLFQNFALIDNETVEKNLEIALTYRKDIKKPQKRILMEEALKKVGLSGFLNKKVYQLSGGEQQRVALARLMLKPCDIVLADEPTGSLDDDNKKQVLEIIKNLNKEGKTVLIVTHDHIVVDMCERNIAL